MFVILEGFDKTGKTTILKEFGKINSWEQIIIDRGPAGYLFYDEFYGRDTKERTNQYLEDLKLIQENPDNWCAIYLSCNSMDIIERHHKAQEEIPLPEKFASPIFPNMVSLDDFKEANLMQKTVWLNMISFRYERKFDECYRGMIPILKINTSENDLKSTREKIDKFIKEIK